MYWFKFNLFTRNKRTTFVKNIYFNKTNSYVK